MVGEILNTDSSTIVKRSKGIIMSAAFKEDGTTYKHLPPSAKFPGLFDNYVGELTAAPASHRASNPKKEISLEVGKLPTRPKVKISE